MTTEAQADQQANQQEPKEVKSNREWKLNLVGAYFKTFETSNTIAKEPPKEILRGPTKFVLINFGMVMDVRNVERGLATYAEEIGEWPKIYEESIVRSV